MVECTRCGCHNDIDSRFCAACGFSMLPQLIQRSATPVPGYLQPQAPWPAQVPPPSPAYLAAAHAPARSEPDWAPLQRRPGQVSDSWNPPRPSPGYTIPQPNQMPNEVSPRTATPPVGQTNPSMAAAPILLGFFVSFDGNDLGRFWPLHQGQLLVGRAQAADNLDIAIEHNTTSARHAQLVALARPSRLTVQDIGSTNGTFVNDQRILPGQPAMAVHGDRIRFGGYTVNVVLIARTTDFGVQ